MTLRLRRRRLVHFRSIRMRNNAGMDFPVCQADKPLLNMNAARWHVTHDAQDVTCQKCRNIKHQNHFA